MTGHGLAPQITGVQNADPDGVEQGVPELKNFSAKGTFLATSVTSVVFGAMILWPDLNLDVDVECPEVPEEPELP